jgi:hypothetical protein
MEEEEGEESQCNVTYPIITQESRKDGLDIEEMYIMSS